jgi:hypothetical protein
VVTSLDDKPFETFAVPAAATTESAIKKPWSAEWKAGGPETTSKYDPDALTPEPCGVLQPLASRIKHQKLRELETAVSHTGCLRPTRGVLQRIQIRATSRNRSGLKWHTPTRPLLPPRLQRVMVTARATSTRTTIATAMSNGRTSITKTTKL